VLSDITNIPSNHTRRYELPNLHCNNSSYEFILCFFPSSFLLNCSVYLTLEALSTRWILSILMGSVLYIINTSPLSISRI
jgi:hypothetical protein